MYFQRVPGKYTTLPICRHDSTCTSTTIILTQAYLNVSQFQTDQIQSLQRASIDSCRIGFDGKISTIDGVGNLADVKRGVFCIIHCHPEAIFNTSEGQELLECGLKLGTIVIDECHIVEEW